MSKDLIKEATIQLADTLDYQNKTYNSIVELVEKLTAGMPMPAHKQMDISFDIFEATLAYNSTFEVAVNYLKDIVNLVKEERELAARAIDELESRIAKMENDHAQTISELKQSCGC